MHRILREGTLQPKGIELQKTKRVGHIYEMLSGSVLCILGAKGFLHET